MPSNVIILTSGLSGSSVLTALIARAGHWTGASTQQKEDYDTHENTELIRLNRRLFSEANYTGSYTTEFSPEAIARLASLHGTIDDSDYKLFLKTCDNHQPWIWKDPRLWMTIRFWKNLLDLRECRFIFLTRGLMQSWVSALLRRQIRQYSDFKHYETQIQSSILGFLADNRLPYLHLRYEDLIVRPENSLWQLNGFLDTKLSIEDLKAVYGKPLFRNPRPSRLKYLKALLIYLKNWRVGSRTSASHRTALPSANH